MRLHPGQSTAFRDMFVDRIHTNHVIVCCRGWGKSHYAAGAAVTGIFELMALPEYITNKYIYIVAPTHDQVTDVYYPILAYQYGLEDIAVTASKDRGLFTFPGRVELRLVSYESVERMRGKGPYMTIWDEISSCSKGIKPVEAWEQIILPAMSSRWSPEAAERKKAVSPYRSIFIGTPKGYNFLYDAFQYQNEDDRWKSYQFDYTQSPLTDLKEVERQRHLMDPVTFNSEYGATFEDSGNSIFYGFNRKKHVRNDLEDFKVGETVHAAIDFNVGLQCTSLFALRGREMQFLDELKGAPNTEELARTLRARFGADKKIIAFPDPTGKARKTSAPVGITDFKILERYGIVVLAREGSPPIVDSVQAVNGRLENAAGEINMFFHPRVKGTIISMERTKWLDKPDSAMIDKSEGIEHYSDGVRYASEFLFPLHRGKSGSRRGTMW